MIDPSVWENPRYTPAVRDVPDLLTALTEERDEARLALLQTLLGRQPRAAMQRALLRLSKSDARHPELVRLVGKLYAHGEAAEIAAVLRPLLRAQDDSHDARRMARYAALALAEAQDLETEEALIEAFQKGEPALRRAAIKALATAGGVKTLELLRSFADDGQDAEVSRLVGKARLLLERRLGRTERGRIRDDVAMPKTLRVYVILTCRLGLEPVLMDEIAATGAPLAQARVAGPGQVEGILKAPLQSLWRLRTFDALHLRLDESPVPHGFAARSLNGGEDEAALWADALAAPRVEALLKGLSEGRLTVRLAWQGEGKQRALIWRVAQHLVERAPWLVNDPRESLWEVTLLPPREEGAGMRMVWTPKGLADPRFKYRVALHQAGSRPTIAAALARLGGVRPGDVVWDPFVGSGTELIERAALGPYRALIGSDLDAAMIEAARANLSSAGVGPVQLFQGDACSAALAERPTLIVTNPPFGRRSGRGDPVGVLGAFLDHALAMLAPGGRLVWLSPFPAATFAKAKAMGMRVTVRLPIDMGGIPAEAQVFEKV